MTKHDDDAMRYNSDMDLADQLAASDACRALLRKLNVADLRVLARKYWHMDKAEAATLSKQTLVEELALENGEQIMDDMWRTRRVAR